MLLGWDRTLSFAVKQSQKSHTALLFPMVDNQSVAKQGASSTGWCEKKGVHEERTQTLGRGRGVDKDH